MTKVRKAYIDGPTGQIHYRETGTGKPLILAHQSPSNSRMFGAALPLLADLGIRAIAVDTPGYGESDVPDSPPTIDDYAKAIREVINGLGVEHAHVLGHHTGAMIMCRLAVLYPECISSIIFNGPPIFNQEEIEQFSSLPLEPFEPKTDGSHLLEAWNNRLKFSPGWTNLHAMHNRLIDQLWAGDTFWYGFKAAFQHSMKPDLMEISCPALILTNTGDDIYHLARRCRDMRPDFSYFELEGGTHDIVDEQPEAWAKAVANFVLTQT